MYKITGKKLEASTVKLGGSKNAILPIIAASCLCSEDVTLHNVPTKLNDVKVMLEVLNGLGFKNKIVDDSTVIMLGSQNTDISSDVSEEASLIRYSLLFMSILLSKTGKLNMPSPGGCNFGERKYDIHLDSLIKMGATMEDDCVKIVGDAPNGLKGTDLNFHTATTTGTENVLIAAAMAKGKTTISNAHTNPEVNDMINFLNSVGAKITYKPRYIEVEGVDRLGGGEYTITSDRMEAVTFMILAAIHRSEICIENYSCRDIPVETDLLRNIGVEIFEWGGNIYISAKDKELNPFSMCTGPFPAITDMQPLFSALAATIKGQSVITEMRWAERFQYVSQFNKMGIDINNYQNCAVVDGGATIKGADVFSNDLRAGAALTLLATAAEGDSIIRNSYQIGRGYNGFVEKLCGLGLIVEELPEE